MSKTIVIFTDAWLPQVNGVVTTLVNVAAQCELTGHKVIVVHPGLFRLKFDLPSYKEIKVAIPTHREINKIIGDVEPDYIHIATEGPIGFQAMRLCKENNWAFTTSYHTRFPEYIRQRYKVVPQSLVYRYLKIVHGPAAHTLAPTKSIVNELGDNGFDANKLHVWGRGVDPSIFYYKEKRPSEHIDLLYVGRISVEKNIEDFLLCDIGAPVHKTIVGDGPMLQQLKDKYKNDESITFVGNKFGKELADHYRNADVFVFPSKTDTFGIVQIEAMACGTPVAAYDVCGPRDVIVPTTSGHYSNDLAASIQHALRVDRQQCSESVEQFTWKSIADQFVNLLVPRET